MPNCCQGRVPCCHQLPLTRPEAPEGADAYRAVGADVARGESGALGQWSGKFKSSNDGVRDLIERDWLVIEDDDREAGLLYAPVAGSSQRESPS